MLEYIPIKERYWWKTYVDYWGNNTMEGLLELMNSSSQNLYCTGNYYKNNSWKLTLFANKDLHPRDKKQAFCYEMTFKLNLEEILSDGKSLLEHCSAEVDYGEMQGAYSTILVIDRNIESLNCNLNLNDLVKDEITDGYLDRWYPSNLLAQAVINCVIRQNEMNKRMLKGNF